ncbi:hypothetical protein GIB67_039087 [Kingdonia uniflora]|uniref:Uncharacterized protein n=1 Tax=Kingdonia uniflora TaxID=39325 RepID=A0A7J7LLB1_9MAGN|nr:hypothetical protein GIB67_039087 [Kingdonia uniflora]
MLEKLFIYLRLAKIMCLGPLQISVLESFIMSSCVKPLMQSDTTPVVFLHGFDRKLPSCDVTSRHEHLYQVSKMVLIDASFYIEGTGKLSTLPRAVAYAGVSVSLPGLVFICYLEKWQGTPLKYPICSIDEHMIDWTNVDRLHCLLPWWEDATINFMAAGDSSPPDGAKVRNCTMKDMYGITIAYKSIMLSGVAPEEFYSVLVDVVILDDVQLFMEGGTLGDISSDLTNNGLKHPRTYIDDLINESEDWVNKVFQKLGIVTERWKKMDTLLRDVPVPTGLSRRRKEVGSSVEVGDMDYNNLPQKLSFVTKARRGVPISNQLSVPKAISKRSKEARDGSKLMKGTILSQETRIRELERELLHIHSKAARKNWAVVASCDAKVAVLEAKVASHDEQLRNNHAQFQAMYDQEYEVTSTLKRFVDGLGYDPATFELYPSRRIP